MGAFDAHDIVPLKDMPRTRPTSGCTTAAPTAIPKLGHGRVVFDDRFWVEDAEHERRVHLVHHERIELLPGPPAQLRERLMRELKTNVSINIEDTDKAGVFNVKARGAMQIEIGRAHV